MRGPGSRLYAHAATPTPTHAISFKKAPLFKDGGIAAGDGGKRLSGAWSVDGANADFRPLRRADVAVTPPDRPLSPSRQMKAEAKSRAHMSACGVLLARRFHQVCEHMLGTQEAPGGREQSAV